MTTQDDRAALVARLEAEYIPASWSVRYDHDGFFIDLRDLIERDGRELAAKDARIAELQDWRDTAVANCARRQCALRDRRSAELEAEIARLCAEVERLTDERARGTAALRAAFGEELWRLGHPAYVVVHLREELAKLDRLWKSATNERDALLARVEAAERDAARYRYWRSLSGPVPACFTRLCGDDLDAAIDAAMEGGK